MKKEKIRIFVYPHTYNAQKWQNPYITDFINSLKNQGVVVTNEFSNIHALWSVRHYINKSNVFVFHWIENVPLYNYGFLQFLFISFILPYLKIRKKKIIWFRHNFLPHNSNNKFEIILCRSIMKMCKSKSDLIITHASKGLQDLQNFKNKAHFILHPTKLRVILPRKEKKYDLLIWGNISKYKGVAEFLTFNKNNEILQKKEIKIVGKCSDPFLLSQIKNLLTKNVSFENRPIEIEELKHLVSETDFVLIPYASESVLSSGILMDSLSVGAHVIGPNIGAFNDLNNDADIEVKVFNVFEDILNINYNSDKIYNYNRFLKKHNWNNFSSILINQISMF